MASERRDLHEQLQQAQHLTGGGGASKDKDNGDADKVRFLMTVASEFRGQLAVSRETLRSTEMWIKNLTKDDHIAPGADTVKDIAVVLRKYTNVDIQTGLHIEGDSDAGSQDSGLSRRQWRER